MMNFTKFRTNDCLYSISNRICGLLSGLAEFRDKFVCNLVEVICVLLLKTSKTLKSIWFSYTAGYQVGYRQTLDQNQNCFRIDGNNQELNKFLY